MAGNHYHYLESGLDNIYLANGFRFVDGPSGRRVVIRDIDKLHEAIGKALASRKESLSGKDIRFLRHEMLLSQAMLAKLLGVSDQAVARWEKGKSDIPKPAETLIRLLYREHVHDTSEIKLKERLEKLADLANAIDVREVRMKNQNRDWRLAA